MASRSAAVLYQSTLSRTVKHLEDQMQDEQRREGERKAALLAEEEKARKAEDDHRLAMQRNAEDLREQISLDLQRKLEQRRDLKRCGIDPTFSGFPNRPETSNSVRIRRKREQQQEMRNLLESQIREKELKRQQEKSLTMSCDMEAIQRAREDLERHAQERAKKLQQQREELRQAWEDTEFTQLLMNTLNEGFPRSETLAGPSAPSEDAPSQDTLHETEYSAMSTSEVEEPEEQPVSPVKKERDVGSASLSVPQPTVQQYRATDFRDDSLGRQRARNPAVCIASVAPVVPGRSLSHAKAGSWSFITEPVPARHSIMRGAGLRVLKSQTLTPPLIATTKTLQLLRPALPQYGMLLTKPRTLNNV